MHYKSILTAASLSLAILTVQPAAAHKVIASVFTSGANIEGEIAFSNGDYAKNTLVEVFDDDGTKLGETKTDDEGFFVFTPSKPVTHVFTSNLGAGHVASTRLEAPDLPRTLAQAGSTPAQPTAEKPASTPQARSLSATIAARTQEENQAALRQMIKQEITPLRRELIAYKEKNDLQTILGGLGYIFGLFGLFFYLSARRKLQGK